MAETVVGVGFVAAGLFCDDGVSVAAATAGLALARGVSGFAIAKLHVWITVVLCVHYEINVFALVMLRCKNAISQ